MPMSRAGDILPERYIHADPMTGRAMAIRVRLRDLLEKRGMAQTELQARSGLGYSTINALYHGKTERVEFATLEALCRSEEHTSELQSQSNLVCRLLLEKTKATVGGHGYALRATYRRPAGLAG